MRQQCISSGGQPKIKVLADADVVLELFINRQQFIEGAEKLLTEIAQSQQAEVYVTDKCLKRIRLEEGLGEEAALFIEKMLCGRVIKIDSSIREEARTYCLPDYDSAEEVACAKNEQLNAIVTQNPQNFDGTNSSLIWSVENLLTRLQLEKNLEILAGVNFNSIIRWETNIWKTNILQTNLARCTSVSYLGKTKTSFFDLEVLDCDIIVQFRSYELVKKARRVTNFYWSPQRRFEHSNDWMSSDEALLLFRNIYPLLKNDSNWQNRIKHPIFSFKYLNENLLKFIQYKFPKKNRTDSYQLHLNSSPYELKLLQHNCSIWHLKLSLTLPLKKELVL